MSGRPLRDPAAGPRAAAQTVGNGRTVWVAIVCIALTAGVFAPDVITPQQRRSYLWHAL